MQAIPSRLLPRRLHHQLALLFAILFALSITVYGKFTREAQYDMTIALLEQQALRWTMEAATDGSADIFRGDQGALQTSLSHLLLSADADQLAAFGKDGVLLVQIGREEGKAVPLTEPASYPVPAGEEASVAVTGEGRFGRRILAWAPVLYQGQRVGWVRGEFDTVHADEARSDILKSSLIVGSIMIFSATLLVFVFLRAPLASLRRATDFANELDSRFGSIEDFSAAPTEIHELGDALNWASLRLFDQNAALTEGERRKGIILDAALECIIAVDAAACITEFNPAAEQTFGYRRQEVVGHPVLELVVPPDLREYTQRLMDEYFNTGDSPLLGGRREMRAMRHDGSEFPIEAAIAAITDGASRSFIVYLRDITERKQTEAALQHAKEAAEEANRAKSGFLANMSHEIRTPMNAILGMTDLALDTKLDTEQREYLSLVKASADALLGIINDILDFSKIEAGRLSFEAIPFSLHDAVSMVVRTLGSKAQEKGITLGFDMAPGLPDTFRGDPLRLRQVLFNLIGNALKFTEQGEITVTVAMEAEDAVAPQLRFSVRDTGIGIPPDKQQAIFEAFSQADSSTTRRFGGTGLGLTICQRLVHLMDGRIWVESTPGAGSTFHFTACLPLTDEQSRAVAEVQKFATLAHCEQHLHILLAEDNPVNQTLAKRLLEKLGHRVSVVDNGRKAVAISAEEHFDVIFMDVQMPVLGGFEATAQIRERETDGRRRLPIIAMTAHAMDGDREKCLAAGMDAYVSKPIQTPMLIAAIQETTAVSSEVADIDADAKKPTVIPEVLFEREAMLANLDGDLDLMQQLAQMFIDDLPSELDKLNAALAANDPHALYTAAHAVKGVVANFGARPLLALLVEIERATGTDRLGDSIAASQAEQLARVTVMLRQLATELAA